jgi:RNA polymerase sigma-70 factor (ECF subfamily)
MPESDHDELIRQAKAGDRRAFDALVGPLVNPAYRLAFGMLHDREAAEDAVQEAAFKAWRKLSNLRDGSGIKPWFFAIVANQCRTIRRSRWWSVLRLGDSDQRSLQIEDRIVRGADLRQALRRLNDDQRLAVVLHYYLDLPLEEVAAIVRAPVGTVKSRIHRGLEQIRPQIEAREAFQ